MNEWIYYSMKSYLLPVKYIDYLDKIKWNKYDMSFFKISIKSYIIFPYIVKLDICIIYFVIFDVYFEDNLLTI